MAPHDHVHLVLRRATFGPRPAGLDAAVSGAAGLDAIVAGLLRPGRPDAGAAATPAPSFGPSPLATLTKAQRQQPEEIKKARAAERTRTEQATLWWLDRMVVAEHQLAEKLVWFWSGHWATGIHKVVDAGMMLNQQQIFRSTGRADFGAMVPAMLRDPALIRWLDGERNTAKAPNENLARELMELFVLGIGRYSEPDVKEGARALTGWMIDRVRRTLAHEPKRFDAGPKTILGQTGPFDADGFATVLMAQPAQAEFLAARLWFRFASTDPIPPASRQRMVAAYGPGHSVDAMMRALFTDPAFPATAGQMVREPVDWAVGAFRHCGTRPTKLAEPQRRSLLSLLTRMGQVPFDPPSVGGWPAGGGWLTTAATQARITLAGLVAGAADQSVLGQIAGAAAGDRPRVTARLLGLPEFSERTTAALTDAKGDPRKLLTLGLVSPEYTVS